MVSREDNCKRRFYGICDDRPGLGKGMGMMISIPMTKLIGVAPDSESLVLLSS